MHTWVIGAGGLLGSALCRQIENPFFGRLIPWASQPEASHALVESLMDFAARTNGEPWRIIWAAGRATTAAFPWETEHELAIFERFLSALQENTPRGLGVFTLVSSAGAVYAGSRHPPFTTSTPIRPLSSYGQLKLAQEQTTDQLSGCDITTLIVRVSNIYGPGQDLTKLQGIVSRLCWAAISRDRANIFVPLDTIRDYIYVHDAASRILHQSNLLTSGSARTRNLKIVASGQPMSLGHVVNTVRDVLHMPVPVSFGTHPTATAQSRDLRLTPDTDESILRMPLTPFPAGVRQVFEDLLRRRQNPESHPSLTQTFPARLAARP